MKKSKTVPWGIKKSGGFKDFSTYGTSITAERRGKRGTHKAVLISSSGVKGGISGQPGVEVMKWIQRKLKPIRIPPTKIMDANGTVVAMLVVDSVTGERRRVPIDQYVAEQKSKPPSTA